MAIALAYMASQPIHVSQSDKWKLVAPLDENKNEINGCGELKGDYRNTFVILERGVCTFTEKVSRSRLPIGRQRANAG